MIESEKEKEVKGKEIKRRDKKREDDRGENFSKNVDGKILREGTIRECFFFLKQYVGEKGFFDG